jgi:hypothetical protein
MCTGQRSLTEKGRLIERSGPKSSAGHRSAPRATWLRDPRRPDRCANRTLVTQSTHKALRAGFEQGPRHGANATGALGRTNGGLSDERPKGLLARRYWGFGAQPAQPGQSIQRYISPSRTSWNDGGAGGGSTESRAITSRGPCRSSSAAVVQWIWGCSSEARRSQRQSSIVSSTSHTAETCSATFPFYLPKRRSRVSLVASV